MLDDVSNPQQKRITILYYRSLITVQFDSSVNILTLINGN